jgi:hypothetical protein
MFYGQIFQAKKHDGFAALTGYLLNEAGDSFRSR